MNSTVSVTYHVDNVQELCNAWDKEAADLRASARKYQPRSLKACELFGQALGIERCADMVRHALINGESLLQLRGKGP